MNKTLPHGLIAAPFTPFKPDGSLWLDPISRYASWLAAGGVTGAFVCGTTGEGFSLSVEERCKVTEAWMSALPVDFRLIVHVGHNSISEARRLAQHAAASGAHAIAAMPPFFFKPNGVDEVVRWCQEIASAASDLPFFYYHIPSMSGVELRMLDFVTKASSAIPSFSGIKYTYEDLEDFSRCVEWSAGRYEMYFGRDELLLSALRVGATGAVGSTYNFAGAHFRKLINAFEKGDLVLAANLQEQAVQFIEVCVKGSWHPLAAFKWLLSRLGMDCGPTRLPIPALNPESIQILENKLADFIESHHAQLVR